MNRKLKSLMNFKVVYVLACFQLIQITEAQTNSWQLWASGLQQGTFPRIAIGSNHDLYYGLNGTAGTKGLIYKANTQQPVPTFTTMPAIPVPASITNNIQSMVCNANSEPVVGFFRSNSTEPFLFRYDNIANMWTTCSVDLNPVLGAFCMAKSPDGTLWVGAKWAYVYKSSDNGASFTHIDETPLVQQNAPCYYPAWNGNSTDAAIYAINVDGNGRVYAGTEGAGVVYSDDNGASWYPADFYACKASSPGQKDSSSVMMPLSHTGNVGGLGFTANNDLIWNGTDMFYFNWYQNLCFADMSNHTVQNAMGIQNYFIGSGLQVTKIVTTANGEIFIHSGSNASVPSGTIGIYRSSDGINWTPFNTGITGANTGQAQGSLAVDGNKVFMATTDGKIFVYDASSSTTGISSISPGNSSKMEIFPNPAHERLYISNCSEAATIEIENILGSRLLKQGYTSAGIDVSGLPRGNYLVHVTTDNSRATMKINLD